jgi:hypothetical protein
MALIVKRWSSDATQEMKDVQRSYTGPELLVVFFTLNGSWPAPPEAAIACRFLGNKERADLRIISGGQEVQRRHSQVVGPLKPIPIVRGGYEQVNFSRQI